MAARSASVVGRAMLECLLAAVAAIVIARAYSMRERQRIAQQLDGNEVETDGESIIELFQIVLGTGVFMTLCALAFILELVLWLRHRRLAPAR